MLFARLNHRHEAFLDGKPLVDVLLLGVLDLIGVLMKDKQSGVHANLVDMLRSFDGDRGSLVMHVRREWNVLIPLGNLRPDLLHRLRLAEAGRGHTDKLAALAVQPDDLLDACVDVSRLLRDHRLNQDVMAAAHGNGADAAGRGLPSRIRDVQIHRLSYTISTLGY